MGGVFQKGATPGESVGAFKGSRNRPALGAFENPTRHGSILVGSSMGRGVQQGGGLFRKLMWFVGGAKLLLRKRSWAETVLKTSSKGCMCSSEHACYEHHAQIQHCPYSQSRVCVPFGECGRSVCVSLHCLCFPFPPLSSHCAAHTPF